MRKTNEDRQHFSSKRHSDVSDGSKKPFSRPALTVISANAEGLSSPKEEYYLPISAKTTIHLQHLQKQRPPA